MKLRFTLILGVLISLGCKVAAQNVGIGTNAPHSSAKLHLEDPNRGILFPRVSLVAVTNGTTPVSAPVKSLLVFNTNAAITGGSGEGFYYWDGTMWVALAGGPADAWLITGNSGTSAATNFIGTKDAVDWVVRTNNTEVMRATSGQKVGVGMTNPTYKLDVTSAVLAIRGTTSGLFTTSVYGYSTNAVAGIGVAGQSDGNSPLMAGLYGVALNGSMALITNGPSNMNVNGGNFDTRIEGDTDEDLFYVDASADYIGISTNSPTNILDIEANSSTTATASNGLELNQTGTGDIAIDWKLGGVSKSTWYIDNSQAGDPFVVDNPAYGVIYRRDVSGRVGIGYHLLGLGVDEPNTSLSVSSSQNNSGEWILKCLSTTLSTPRFGVRSDGGMVLYNRSKVISNSVADGVILFAEEVSSSSELKVRDEAGNITTLSPHNYSIIPEGASNNMGWAYYSENPNHQKAINIDMFKMADLVEQLSGENLIYTADLENKKEDGTFSEIDEIKRINNSLKEVVGEQQIQIDDLQKQILELKRLFLKK